eukprot:NODE_80_length_22829_cov_0.188121.p8 type:complete len:136 gc:universal NODE_80_length_22829_cov_0.188121:16115-15708(-)
MREETFTASPIEVTSIRSAPPKHPKNTLPVFKPIPTLIAHLPSSARISLYSWTAFCISNAALMARSSGNASSSIKPKPHMRQSPINLSTIPLCLNTMLTIRSKNPFNNSKTSSGVSFSERAVNDLISANNMVPSF